MKLNKGLEQFTYLYFECSFE